MATKNYASKSQLIAIMGDAATKTSTELAKKVDILSGSIPESGVDGSYGQISYDNSHNITLKKYSRTTSGSNTNTREHTVSVDDGIELSSTGLLTSPGFPSGGTGAYIKLYNGKGYYLGDNTSDSTLVSDANEIVNKGFLSENNYTKSEVDNLISTAKTGRFIAVATLPDVATADATAIYLVPKASPETQNIKDEYIVVVTHDESTDTDVKSWEKIGETTIDLSGYATETWVTNQIAAIDVPADLSSSDVDDIKAAFSLS